MMPDKYKRKDLPHHPTCAKYDIDVVEKALISSKLYNKIQQFPNMMALNKPSLNDEHLNGTYCSSYNHQAYLDVGSIEMTVLVSVAYPQICFQHCRLQKLQRYWHSSKVLKSRAAKNAPPSKSSLCLIHNILLEKADNNESFHFFAKS
jgi:hypothetical protein